MLGFVVVAGKAGALYFDGTGAFVKDLYKAKAYANAVAAKRAPKTSRARRLLQRGQRSARLPDTMGSTPASLLLDAGRLIANPAHWCQGALARTAAGTSVCPTSKRARVWDLAGVIYRLCDQYPALSVAREGVKGVSR